MRQTRLGPTPLSSWIYRCRLWTVTRLPALSAAWERAAGARTGLIPIIALTANAFADDVYRAKQAVMDEHVTKPLEISRLLEIMHRYLDVPARNHRIKVRIKSLLKNGRIPLCNPVYPI